MDLKDAAKQIFYLIQFNLIIYLKKMTEKQQKQLCFLFSGVEVKSSIQKSYTKAAAFKKHCSALLTSLTCLYSKTHKGIGLVRDNKSPRASGAMGMNSIQLLTQDKSCHSSKNTSHSHMSPWRQHSQLLQMCTETEDK